MKNLIKISTINSFYHFIPKLIHNYFKNFPVKIQIQICVMFFDDDNFYYIF